MGEGSKEGGIFFSLSLGEGGDKKGGQLTFYSIFRGGEYAGLYESNRKNDGIWLFGGKRSCLKRIRREVKVGTLSLSNDENNVIAKNAFSCF